MRDVARAAHDRQVGVIGAHAIHQRDAVLDAIDRVDEQSRLADAGGTQQVEARRVAVEHLVAELAQRLDLVGIVVEHHRPDVVGEQQAPDDLPEASEARDDHRPAGVDGVRLPFGLGAPADPAVVRDEEDGREHHRQRHDDGEEPHPLRRQHARQLGGAEDHERELAALGQREREEPAFRVRYAEQARDHPQRGDLEAEEAREHPQHLRRAAGQQAEIDRHADGDEEQAQQQPLEGLDHRFQRVAELGVGEQYPGEEGAQRHRKPGQRHQLGHTQHQQQREGGEELADTHARDHPEQRPREVAADEDHARDRGGGEQHPHPQRLPGRGSGVRQQRHRGDERDRGDVLEEQDAERRLAGRRGELVPLRHRLQRDRGGREREGRAADHGEPASPSPA
jgi:hypothetical protein